VTETLIERWAKLKPHFRCPQCDAISFNPTDIRERYCGRCHLFFGRLGPVRGRIVERQHSDDSARRTSTDDTPISNPFANLTFDAGTYDPAPPAPDPPSTIDPGGGSSGGGGASSDY
jgi:uncharacterized membrane protein YgcG